MKPHHLFFATTAKGMEALLHEELTKLGAQDISLQPSGVQFSGPLQIGYQACLHSRIANRVLLVLKKIAARDAEELYSNIKSIPWQEHLTVDHTFAVDFLAARTPVRNDSIIHTHFGALKVKDAIVDQFRSKTNQRPSVDAINPDVRINVYLYQHEAVVSIDLSGESLHKRGYRQAGAEAPLKENLAAGIIMTTGFAHKEGFDFIDPMCGSGTLVIEAAMMASHVAPGLLRTSFGFLGWLGHEPLLWQRLRQDAEGMIIKNRKKIARITGYDKSAYAVDIARANLEKAGLAKLVSLETQELAACKPSAPHGILVANPPYGERLGDVDRLKPLYQQMGDVMKQKFKGWEGYIFTGNLTLAKSIGLKASRRHIFYNGPIECRLLKYDLY